MQHERVLGIDPGSVITGWGVVETDGNRLLHVDNGGIFTRQKEFHHRLREIYEGISEIVKTYQPTYVSMEQVFVSRNAQSALKLGHARGVALIVVLNAGLQVSEYTPSQIKKAVTGSGRADKEQVGLMVQSLLGLPEPAQTDASDALATAICHLLQPNLPDLLKEALPATPKSRKSRSRRKSR